MEQAPARFPWRRLLGFRQTWAIVIGKFLTDPIWWFYLYWLAKFLNSRFGLTLSKLGPPLIVTYLIADIGSVGGGWGSLALIRRGWTVNRSRKTVMLVSARLRPARLRRLARRLGPGPPFFSSPLAAAAHQAWSANIFTFASDMFPKQAVGSVTGLGGTAGAVGGISSPPPRATSSILSGATRSVCRLRLDLPHSARPHSAPAAPARARPILIRLGARDSTSWSVPDTRGPIGPGPIEPGRRHGYAELLMRPRILWSFSAISD